MIAKYARDPRAVMTLDAGGTNLVFSAIRGGKPAAEAVTIPSGADDLKKCLGNIVQGFELVKKQLPEPPAAISFAFPGPADYPSGIIGNLPNLPAFRGGGVPLGPMLEDRFKVPVFINNDGDLFVYGEAVAGFLPFVNAEIEKAGGARRYRNLFGVTLGTGFGGGITINGELFIGDNSAGAEAWLLRNKLDPSLNAEEGACIRAVRGTYARLAGIPPEKAPEPRTICDIGKGAAPGDRAAALEAFRRLGETAGDAIAQALTLVDGLAVIGGGVSGAHELFLPALVDAVNGVYDKPGGPLRRLLARAFNFEDPAQRAEFLKGGKRRVAVPGSGREVEYDPLQRTAIGISRLGTSEAVAIGAYAFALRKLS
ncbi:MAG TPA: ROK family protein [Elusimicrobiales bacterium]|nr:ROK family protein [Elusimicrobiales bacterium]